MASDPRDDDDDDDDTGSQNVIGCVVGGDIVQIKR